MIGIDLDGVIAEFCLPFTRVAREVGAWGNAAYRTEQQTQWSFSFDINRAWARIDQTYNWWMTLPPLVSEFEIKAINHTIDKNGAIAFVTSRRATLGFAPEMQARLWLQSIGIDAYINCPVVCADQKGDACKALGVTAFLDDKPRNLDDLSRAGIVAVARRWQYNKSWRGESVDSVSEFLGAYG